MALSFFFCQEQTCRFNNIISADFAPFQISRVLFGSNADSFAINNELAVFNFDSTVKFAVHCIIAQHICHIFNIDEVIDAYNFNIVSFLSGTENQAADTSKTVDTNANSHINILP